MFLSIKDLKKSFGEDEYKTEVLKGIDFEIDKDDGNVKMVEKRTQTI